MRRAENGGRALPASPGAPPPREAVGANRPGQKSETLLCSRKQRGGRGRSAPMSRRWKGKPAAEGEEGRSRMKSIPVHRLAGSALRCG